MNLAASISSDAEYKGALYCQPLPTPSCDPTSLISAQSDEGSAAIETAFAVFSVPASGTVSVQIPQMPFGIAQLPTHIREEKGVDSIESLVRAYLSEQIVAEAAAVRAGLDYLDFLSEVDVWLLTNRRNLYRDFITDKISLEAMPWEESASEKFSDLMAEEE